MPDIPNEDDLADDRLRGEQSIGDFLGENKRRVQHMIKLRLIPYTKEGRSTVSYKSWLREHRAAQKP
jgi:hypothetical protein